MLLQFDAEAYPLK